MTADLRVEWKGIKFPNPFIIASVPATCAWGFNKAAKYGWGGGIHWQGEVQSREGASYHGYIPRDYPFIGKPPAWWSFQNSCGPKTDVDPKQVTPPDMVERCIRQAKKSGMIVGANLQEGFEPDAWAKVTAAADRAGADFFEINWSCPYFPNTGYDIGVDRNIRLSTIKAVRATTGRPIMVKINASFGKEELARMVLDAVENGADAISCSNTLRGFAGVDIETGIPLSCELDVNGKLRGAIGGISGPAIKPMVLRAVAEIRQVTDLPISAIGGITQWQSAMEYMLLGASTVQIGTAVMVYGYRIIKQLTKGLEEYMERKGYKTIADFVGKTTEKYMLSEYSSPMEKQPKKMVVNEAKCTGCGRCLLACEASSTGSGALKIVNKVAEIDHNLCKTCNTCSLVCPEGAITAQWMQDYKPTAI
jgi:dihydropyrimidine dehydrogenase (NAD+) subunit PreA